MLFPTRYSILLFNKISLKYYLQLLFVIMIFPQQNITLFSVIPQSSIIDIHLKIVFFASLILLCITYPSTLGIIRLYLITNFSLDSMSYYLDIQSLINLFLIYLLSNNTNLSLFHRYFFTNDQITSFESLNSIDNSRFYCSHQFLYTIYCLEYRFTSIVNNYT